MKRVKEEKEDAGFGGKKFGPKTAQIRGKKGKKGEMKINGYAYPFDMLRLLPLLSPAGAQKGIYTTLSLLSLITPTHARERTRVREGEGGER